MPTAYEEHYLLWFSRSEDQIRERIRGRRNPEGIAAILEMRWWQKECRRHRAYMTMPVRPLDCKRSGGHARKAAAV